MKKCIVIYNPNSGHTLKKKNINHYKSIIEEYDYEPSFIGTEYKGHAKEIVSHLINVDLVISMGGDGTFNEVIYGNMERRKKLVVAHIPVGTTNDIGVMFGYGKDIDANLRACLSGEVRGMDICTINKRPFVYVAGIGKFLNIPYETPRDLKKKFGHMAYIVAGFKDFFKSTKNYEVEIEINGEKHHGMYSIIMISSATRIAGINNFYKDVYLDDDSFEVLLCTYTKRLDILRAFSLLVATNANKVSGFEVYRTNKLKVNFMHHHRKPWCVDGEKLEIRTKEYEISNINDVSVLFPKKNIDKLFVKNTK